MKNPERKASTASKAATTETRRYVFSSFIATAAEDDPHIMDRVVANFQGFLDCLENPTIKGTIFCGGVWHVGEIKGKAALKEAYEMGENV